MDTLKLPIEDWESIQNLALGTSVLQFGFCDGTDTITIAQTANFVMCVAQSLTALCVHSSDPFASWDRTVHDAGYGNKVIGTSAAYTRVLNLWPAKSFGLAVVNVFAIGDHDPVTALTEAGYLADTVVVIDDEQRSCEPPVHMLFDQPETVIVRSGTLWVVKHVPDAAAWTAVGD